MVVDTVGETVNDVPSKADPGPVAVCAEVVPDQQKGGEHVDAFV